MHMSTYEHIFLFLLGNYLEVEWLEHIGISLTFFFKLINYIFGCVGSLLLRVGFL